MNPRFWHFWISQALSSLGDVFYQVIIMVWVYQKTQSSLQTSLVLIANILPGFIISPRAGALIDRFSRKTILIWSSFASALVTFSFAFLLKVDDIPLWSIYLSISLLSIITAFIHPSKMAILPSIVSKSKLTQANSFIIGSGQAIMAIGFGAGGFLSSRFQLDHLVLFNSLCFLAGGLMLILLQVREDHLQSSESQTDLETGFFSGLKSSYRLIQKNKLAHPLIIIELIEHIPHGIWSSAITLSFVVNVLEGGMDEWGLMTGVYFGGMLIGAGFCTLMSGFISRNTGKVIIINAVLTTLNTVLFGYSPDVLFCLILSFIFGIPNSVRDVAQDSLLQATLPQEEMGRVYSFKNMFTTFIFMISGFGFAYLSDIINNRYIYYFGAAIYLLTTLIAWSNPKIRQSKISSEPA